MENKSTVENLYTEEQLNYVNSVKNEDLRSHLLHQVRLRDIMEEDRDAFEKESSYKNSIEHAMKVLQNTIKTDDVYRIGWQANIAMAFKDEHYEFAGDGAGSVGFVNRDDIHTIANKAADNFLNLLCK